MRRRSQRTGPARARRPAPRAGALDVRSVAARYASLVAKYRRLVARCEEDVAIRSSATVLALAAMHASTAGLATLDGERFLVRNATWLRLVRRAGRWRAADPGAPPGERGRRDLEAVVRAEAAALARGGGAARVRRWARDGGDETVEIRVEAVDVPGARRIVLAMIADVTDWIRRERELARMRERMTEQDRMRAIGELASGVAHDLNNTFHALGLRLSHLRAPCDAAERERDLAVVERVIADASERVRRLQDLARRRQDRPDERLDLGAVVSDAAEVARPELARRDDAPVVLEVALPALPPVLGSGAELRHVFLNLFLNARDAMPRGGRIRVTGRQGAGGAAEVAVEDEGDGIRPEHLPRLFDPFFTTKGRQGTGLGLAVARSVVDRMGGELRAANRRGGGAAFTLSFPPAPPVAPRGDPEAPGAEVGAPATRRRVLVVDDDEDNLEAMRLVLEQLGHEAETAARGAAAVRLLEAGRRFDLVLCDLGLPDLDGWGVAAAIHARQPDARVVLVTGWAAEIAPDDPRRRGVAAVLAKPLELAQLRRALREARPEPRPAQAAREPAREPGPGAPAQVH